jgi:hypothetical protein
MIMFLTTNGVVHSVLEELAENQSEAGCALRA